MKKLIVPVLLVALVAVGTGSALAGSKKIRHSGELVGVADSKVTLRVSVRGGKPRKVSAFKATGVPTNCDGGKFVFELQALDPTKVTKKNNFKEVLKNSDGSKLTVSGTVKKKGKKVTGFLKTNRFAGGGEAGTCKVPKTKFRTEKG